MRQLYRIGLAVALVLLTGSSVWQQTERVRAERQAPQTFEGISFATWMTGAYAQPSSDRALAQLASTGANWVGIIATHYQSTIASTTVSAGYGTPSEADLIHVIGEAHRLGLKVMFKPHVDLTDDPFHWRGQIGEPFSEADWASWFASYGSWVEWYATLCATQGVEMFCVGTELWATAKRAAEWRALIANVRARFPGLLTYAANRGGEEILVNWWDTLDYIGLDAWYNLTEKDDPTLDELRAAWEPIVGGLAAFMSLWPDKQMILIEMGYRSVDGNNRHPWEWQSTGPVDLQEQADCYQAAYEAFSTQPWVAGIFWWTWYADEYGGGPYETGYTPQGKPAEQLLRSWYGGTAPPTATPTWTATPTPSPTSTATPTATLTLTPVTYRISLPLIWK